MPIGVGKKTVLLLGPLAALAVGLLVLLVESPVAAQDADLNLTKSKVVQEMLGHANISQTMDTYSHVPLCSNMKRYATTSN